MKTRIATVGSGEQQCQPKFMALVGGKQAKGTSCFGDARNSHIRSFLTKQIRAVFYQLFRVPPAPSPPRSSILKRTTSVHNTSTTDEEPAVRLRCSRPPPEEAAVDAFLSAEVEATSVGAEARLEPHLLEARLARIGGEREMLGEEEEGGVRRATRVSDRTLQVVLHPRQVLKPISHIFKVSTSKEPFEPGALASTCSTSPTAAARSKEAPSPSPWCRIPLPLPQLPGHMSSTLTTLVRLHPPWTPPPSAPSAPASSQASSPPSPPTLPATCEERELGDWRSGSPGRKVQFITTFGYLPILVKEFEVIWVGKVVGIVKSLWKEGRGEVCNLTWNEEDFPRR